MKNNKPILLILLSALVVGLICCTNQNEEYTPQAEIPVRLLTSINLGSFSKPYTRAGDIEDNNPIREGLEDGTLNESKINTIRLLAFDAKLQVAANVLFHHPSTTATLPAGDKKYKFSDGQGDNISKIQLDLKILTGAYEFMLIANESSDWNLGSINTTNKKADFKGLAGLKSYVNTLTSETDINNGGIPMIGEANLYIPFVASATETNPYLAPPTIKLKRTLAKMEVNISNTESSTGTTVFETAKVLKIKKITVSNLNQKYNVLEDDTNTVVETKNTAIKNINHATGTLFKGNIFSGYMAERKSTEKKDAIELNILVEKTGGEEIEYSILLYQKKNGNYDYNVYRNSLYRFNFILKGKDILKLQLEVLDWTVESSEVNFNSEIIMESPPTLKIISAYPNYYPNIETLRFPYNAGGQYDVAEFKFKIKEPIDTKWKATITNGLEFAFEPGSVDTGESGTEYTIRIVALKRPSNIIRQTEFYLTINGKEQDPDNYINSSNVKIEGPISIGRGNRYVIKQRAQ